MQITTITRKHGDFHDLVFQVDLSNYGKDENDIDDILFFVKRNIDDADVDAIMDKKLSTSGVSFVSPDIINISWGAGEYTNFDVNSISYAGLFIKFTGDAKFDENVDTLFKIKIIESFTDQ